ncbi:hypothetical protein HOY80DRAFT_374296 [Tuber brumale]|nr:hypothetical protein HOY80DRAFT_374296 [Tuber brumale]
MGYIPGNLSPKFSLITHSKACQTRAIIHDPHRFPAPGASHTHTRQTVAKNKTRKNLNTQPQSLVSSSPQVDPLHTKSLFCLPFFFFSKKKKKKKRERKTTHHTSGCAKRCAKHRTNVGGCSYVAVVMRRWYGYRISTAVAALAVFVFRFFFHFPFPSDLSPRCDGE